MLARTGLGKEPLKPAPTMKACSFPLPRPLLPIGVGGSTGKHKDPDPGT